MELAAAASAESLVGDGAALQAPAAAPPAGRAAPMRPQSGGFNGRYTLDSFVIGSSNRFAHQAALTVAEAPALAYNPLFIHGGTGLGKTHLLQAIAQDIGEHSPQLSVRYVTSETFLNDFINSLRDKRIEGFRQRYRAYDVLLLDDVQFFEHQERIREEFFDTFNSLYGAGSQIVMSSDRPPREIATLEDRLRSRFEWGLVTDIQPPDLETRIAILHRKARAHDILIRDPEVLSFIAGRVTTNIRELEGALTRVVAFCGLTGRPMTVELAQDVLRDVFPQEASDQTSIRRVQDVVAERFNLTRDDLVGDKHSRNIVYPRQVAMYLSRELTDSSLPKIGKEFGGRDHTTVIHATSKIARLIREDTSAWNLVQDLATRLPMRRQPFRLPSDPTGHPERAAAARVLGEPDIAVRRAIVESVGYERLVEFAHTIHRDDYGELLRIGLPGDEPILLVKVVNSTPEPDGTFRDYLIRVDPHCRTAREAVAWTFDVHPDDYQLTTET